MPLALYVHMMHSVLQLCCVVVLREVDVNFLELLTGMQPISRGKEFSQW
jgi:hypothetical protein